MSGCVDHFAPKEKEAFEHTRNIVSTLNFELPEEDEQRAEEPLYATDELVGFAPKDYSHSLDVRMVHAFTSHSEISWGCTNVIFHRKTACILVLTDTEYLMRSFII